MNEQKIRQNNDSVKKFLMRVKMHNLLMSAKKLLSTTNLTVSKRPGTRYQIEIHFDVFNRSYILFSFMKLVET